MKEGFVDISGKKIKMVNDTLKLSKRQIKDIDKVQGLGRLSNLKILYLESNEITEIKGLEKLTKLQEIYMNKNKIKKIEGLEALKNLRMLDLRDNLIQEIRGIETLDKLQTLRLSKNRIQEISNLDHQKNLIRLYLSENKIKEIQGLDALGNLKELWMNKNEISEIKGLEYLKNLQELHLRENQIKEITGLTALVKLEKLYLDKNQIRVINGLETLKNLKKLELSGNPLKASQKALLNRKLSDIIKYCEAKAKQREEKRRLLAERETFTQYHIQLLDSIINEESETFEALTANDKFKGINIKEILLKAINMPTVLSDYARRNQAATGAFLSKKYNEPIPNYRLISKFRLYLRSFLGELIENEILDKVMFNEEIKEIFQFNSNETLYITDKRCILIGKKYVTPPKLTISGLEAPPQSSQEEEQDEKVSVEFVDIFPMTKLVSVYLEQNISKKAAFKKYSHKLTLEIWDAGKEIKKMFYVEEPLLKGVWRICKYMVEHI